MKKKLNTRIICNTKKEISTDDVDHFMYHDILGKSIVNKVYDSTDLSLRIDVVENGVGLADAYPVKIETLKEIIAQLEKEGCNYLTVDYNCDHPDYTFYGIEVHAATDAENIEIEEAKIQKELLEIANQLARLEEQKERLREKADNLITEKLKNK
jgi:hypothetical protein